MTKEVLEALEQIEAHAEDAGDGKWLEALVREHGPSIKHWNVDAVHRWEEWADRTKVFPDSSPEDIAVDLVAEDAAGERLIAIQCKARRKGSAITSADVDGFLSAAAAPEYSEAWIVGTTGPSHGLRGAHQQPRPDQGSVPPTRVGYRIARELTMPGKTPDGANRLTIVLCPSIGLVRQLKTAYETMAESDGIAIRTLAVCSGSER